MPMLFLLEGDANMFAYILIALSECDENNVVDKFIDEHQVEEAHVLFGEWDIIIKIKVQTPENAATFVMEKVRALSEVKLTSTLIVAK